MNEVKKGDVIAVWFSCGAASACAAKLTVDSYPDATVRVLNTPIAEEDEDNRRFLSDVQDWLGVEIEIVTNPAFPTNSAVDVWEKRSFMSSPYGAPCTLELKKKARQIWETENHVDWHVLGFTADERDRFERFTLTERDNVLHVLGDAGMSKTDCYMMVQAAGIKLPRVYAEGYPNANCVGCVKASSPTYWNHVRKTRPEIFAERAEQSRRIGAKLVRHKGERIYLDELPEGARGEPMKNMDFECGLFCMEDV